jgi:hypothetical protein
VRGNRFAVAVQWVGGGNGELSTMHAWIGTSPFSGDDERDVRAIHQSLPSGSAALFLHSDAFSEAQSSGGGSVSVMGDAPEEIGTGSSVQLTFSQVALALGAPEPRGSPVRESLRALLQAPANRLRCFRPNP